MNDLGEIRERRAALVGTCSALEAALSSPVASARWPEGLGNAVAALLATFDEHVTETESRGGTIEQLRERAPRLSDRIDRLSEEHVTIAADAERLMDRLDHLPAERTARRERCRSRAGPRAAGSDRAASPAGRRPALRGLRHRRRRPRPLSPHLSPPRPQPAMSQVTPSGRFTHRRAPPPPPMSQVTPSGRLAHR